MSKINKTLKLIFKIILCILSLTNLVIFLNNIIIKEKLTEKFCEYYFTVVIPKVNEAPIFTEGESTYYFQNASYNVKFMERIICDNNAYFTDYLLDKPNSLHQLIKPFQYLLPHIKYYEPLDRENRVKLGFSNRPDDNWPYFSGVENLDEFKNTLNNKKEFLNKVNDYYFSLNDKSYVDRYNKVITYLVENYYE